MPNNSKTAKPANAPLSKSKTIGTYQGTPFTDLPKGMWHSVAIIKSGNVTLNSDNIDFEFDVPFDDDLEANEGVITVYNLTNNTIKSLKTRQKITIEAGYGDDTGVIYEGKITKVITEYENADKVTTINVIDAVDCANTQVSMEGTTSKEVLKALIDKTGLPVGKFEPQISVEYENGASVDEPLAEAIKKYSEDCGVGTFVNKGKIYSCRLHQVSGTSSFKVSSETGLIGVPSRFDDDTYIKGGHGYEFEMLLQHRITTASAITLNSRQVNLNGDGATYYVKSGSHSFDGTGAITRVKAVWSVDAKG